MRLVVLGAVIGAAIAGSPPQRAGSDTPCRETGDRLLPSRDLYCMELAPVPALGENGVTATLELNRIPSPFGTNVTQNGNQVYAPVLRVEGLPDAAAFEAGARVWIAWITTPQLYPTQRLGVVGNGEYRLPTVDWPKFLILVSAEASSAVNEPSGRIAIRGLSPSARLQPPDMTEFLYGTPPAGDTAARSGPPAGEHAAHQMPAGDSPASGAAAWIHPSMPRGLAMMPAEMRLAPPAVLPFLPRNDAAIPDAKPREVVRLANGDTLTLTATPVRQRVRGQSFIGYGYNGQVPGPTIWAHQGDTVHIRYRNDIGWGTTVHWHGVRLSNAFDGAEGLTQSAVPQGGEFMYSVQLPDAGLFWYHPHRRDDVLRDLGLYGNLMAGPATDEGSPADREEILMLDDIDLTDQGLVPYGTERATHALMGRFGNVPLINGKSGWTMETRRGDVVRFFLTNGSNARTFNLSFGRSRIKVIGSDVSGFEREEWVESVVMGPAERYIVDVQFAEAGRTAIENRVLALDHTFGRFFTQVDTLGMISVRDVPAQSEAARRFATLQEHPRVIADIDRYRRQFARAPDKTLVVRMEAQGLPFVVDRFLRFDSVYFHPVEWGGTMPMMNWNSTTAEVRWILEEPATGRRNMDIRWAFQVGDVVAIRIANLRETLHAMQHPIHFHGQRFLVLRQNGVANTNLAWKDTFLLPAGGTADILLEVSNPGTWMAHCHISEHLESGMMFSFTAK